MDSRQRALQVEMDDLASKLGLTSYQITFSSKTPVPFLRLGKNRILLSARVFNPLTMAESRFALAQFLLIGRDKQALRDVLILLVVETGCLAFVAATRGYQKHGELLYRLLISLASLLILLALMVGMIFSLNRTMSAIAKRITSQALMVTKDPEAAKSFIRKSFPFHLGMPFSFYGKVLDAIQATEAQDSMPFARPSA